MMEEINGNKLKEDNSIPIERGDNSNVHEEASISELSTQEVELKKAQEKMNELEKQVVELKDSLLRRVAEFENYKRRNETEQMNLLKYAAEPFIKQVLSVYDDIERSLSHIDDQNNLDSIKKGLQLVFEKFTKTLEVQGVRKMEAKGQSFDVHLHEALMQQPVPNVPPHIILDVIEPGYIYKDKVIRHAKVIVSAELASQESDNENNSEGLERNV
jgi:molecular chaperone GrpE